MFNVAEIILKLFHCLISHVSTAGNTGPSLGQHKSWSAQAHSHDVTVVNWHYSLPNKPELSVLKAARQ